MTLGEFYIQKVAKVEEELLKERRKKDLYNLNVSETEWLALHLRMKESQNQRTGIERNICMALKRLSNDQLKTVFQKLKTASTPRYVTEQGFLNLVRGQDSGSAQLMDPEYFGVVGIGKILDAYEEALGPETVQQIINTPVPPLPTSPEYRGNLVTHPLQATVDALIKRHTQGKDPAQNQKNLELLTKVGNALESVDRDARFEISEAYSSSPISRFYSSDKPDSMQDRRRALRRQNGLRKLGDGRFGELIQHKSWPNGAPKYSMTEDSFRRPILEEDHAELRRLSTDPDTNLSQETKDAVKALSDLMSQLDYNAATIYLTAEQFPVVRPRDEEARFFPAEQAIKGYGFTAFLSAKEKLRQAVRQGNLQEIERCYRDFEKAERITDEMIGILKSDKLSQEAIFSDNVESLRPGSGDLPSKYLLDYTGQCKLNSLFMGYACLKNAGMTLEDLMNDPYGVTQKLVESYMQNAGLDGRPDSIGAALQFGLKSKEPRDPRLGWTITWDRVAFGLERGLAGIAGMEKDPERREKILALVHLGLMEGSKRVEKEKELYETEQKLVTSTQPEGAAFRGVLYQTAALAPETGNKRFNLKTLVTDLGKERPLQPGEEELEQEAPPVLNGDEEDDELDIPEGLLEHGAKIDDAHKHAWRDVDRQVKGMIQENRAADFRELAGRNKKVLEDAAQEEQLSGCFENLFDPELYLLHAFSAQSRLLRRNLPIQAGDQDLAEFRKSVLETWKLSKLPKVKTLLGLGAMALEDPTALSFLVTGKQDQVKRSDSKEYTRMKESLDKLRGAVATLEGDNPAKIEGLYRRDLEKELAKAKEECFRYYRLKTKDGMKAIEDFHYESGKARAREGLANYNKLCELQDKLGLRSPAQKLFDESRMELLENRHSEPWAREQGLKVLGRMIYAQNLLRAGFTPEEQTWLLSQERLQHMENFFRDKIKQTRYYGEQVQLINEALKGTGKDFDLICDAHAKNLKEQYEGQNAEGLLARAKKGFAKGYAMDVAAKELNVNVASQEANDRFHRLQRKAAEVLKRQEFKEVVDRMTAGKSIEEIRQLHAPGKIYKGGSTKYEENYKLALYGLRYEKRCAEVAAEAMLKKPENNGADMEKVANALRKDPNFLNYVREQTQGKNGNDMSDMVNALADPAVQQQVRDAICQRIPRLPGNLEQNNIIQEDQPKLNHNQATNDFKKQLEKNLTNQSSLIQNH